MREKRPVRHMCSYRFTLTLTADNQRQKRSVLQTRGEIESFKVIKRGRIMKLPLYMK